MEKYELNRWLRTATAKIRYGPDREAVKKELQQHMEDKIDALRRAGLPEEQLESRILMDMGNAEDIAPQLAAVHKPFWGYTYSVLTWITILVVLISLVVVPNGLLRQIDFPSEPEDFTQSTSHYYERVFYDEPNDQIVCDNYTLQIQKAVLWAPKYGESSGDYYAALQIRISRWPTMPEFDAMEYFWAEDNLGTVYVSYADMTHRDGEPFVIPTDPDAGLLTETYYLRVRGVPGPDVKWIDLHYDRDGRDVVIRIELTGGDNT